MRREVPMPMAVAAIVVVLLIVGILFFWSWTGRRQLGGEAAKMPSEVQQEFQRRMGGATPGGQQPGSVPQGGYITPPGGR